MSGGIVRLFLMNKLPFFSAISIYHGVPGGQSMAAAGVEPAPTSNIINYFNILILCRTTGEQPFLFFNQFHLKRNNKIIVILKSVTR